MMRSTTLRPATADDAEAVAGIYAPFVRDTPISFEDTPPDTAQMRERIAAYCATHPYLVAEQSGRVVGYAYASPHRTRAAYRSSVDVTVYVAPDAHRQGIARALYSALIDELIAAGFHRAYAGITVPNAKSIGFHSAMGFRHVGTYREVGFKFGRYHDVAWYERDLNPSSPPGA